MEGIKGGMHISALPPLLFPVPLAASAVILLSAAFDSKSQSPLKRFLCAAASLAANRAPFTEQLNENESVMQLISRISHFCKNNHLKLTADEKVFANKKLLIYACSLYTGETRTCTPLGLWDESETKLGSYISARSIPTYTHIQHFSHFWICWVMTALCCVRRWFWVNSLQFIRTLECEHICCV